jgi:hypothetical protein
MPRPYLQNLSRKPTELPTVEKWKGKIVLAYCISTTTKWCAGRRKFEEEELRENLIGLFGLVFGEVLYCN